MKQQQQDKDQMNRQKGTDSNDTHAEKQTPLSTRISESGLDQLEEKTDRFTHTTEAENKPGTPWSPGQASA